MTENTNTGRNVVKNNVSASSSSASVSQLLRGDGLLCLVFCLFLSPRHSSQPSISATLLHLTLSQNVESLLRGEAVTAEQFLCLWPISRPLIELQLLIKMSESSAFWGPEALFNPCCLLFTHTLPLHPLFPVLFTSPC